MPPSEQESIPPEAVPTSVIHSQASAPLQVLKEPEERKASTETQVVELSPVTSPGFTRLHLPDPPAIPVEPTSTTSVISTCPLLILDLAEKGRLECYAPVEAGYLKALLS